MQICGQEFPEAILERIRCRVQEDAGLTRTGLSREVAQWLDWRDAHGRVKDMNCRVALLKLERRGLVQLPAARAVSFAPAVGGASAVAPSVHIDCTLAALGPIELVAVQDKADSTVWGALMRQHPLGGAQLCGAQLRYLVRSAAGDLGALSFSAAAWRLAARDAHIGWDDARRRDALPLVVNNSRFLILPGVRVPNLASHVLGLAAQRLPEDWQVRYGVRPVLLETFVDSTQYHGTCYRAANWIDIGQTAGRGRQDRSRCARTAAKRILVLPLSRQWREQLLGDQQMIPAPCAAAPADWAEQEFGAVQLPDARLKRRLLTLARDFHARPTANLPQACGSRAAAKAAYRFFDHPKATMQTLLAAHFEATAQRMAAQPIVLAVQDTTSLNYTAHAATDGLGPIGTKPQGPQGLIVHSTLAFTPQGLPLGFLDVQCWARDAEDFGKKARRASAPIEQKESNKWLKSYQAVAAVAARQRSTQIISVGDREADLYELFALAASHAGGPGLLVRARHNRALVGEQACLWPTMQAQPVAAVQPLALPRRGNQAARQAQLEIRFAAVSLQPPKGHARQQPIAAWAVLASEVQAPEGAQPLQWMLLTTLEVSTPEQALQKLQWYTKRWGIEVMHRTLKSGCRIEDRQLASVARLQACLAIDLVVAWRICHLTMLARTQPNAPCTLHFEEAQWQSLMIFTDRNPVAPPTPPTLREAVRRVAGLGGFLARKADGEPGTECLWRGLQRLDDITQACTFFMNHATHLHVSSEPGSG